ncbi:hypothetical protein [Pseudonocardia endophytica]|uniref:GLTT repeat-containing protein n=1 Tax=Pseudonocardia endophytica TaxID=401976 RepID=A0A4R1HWR4_PSEEN|nr:hypothetical protein [Pseudonocardia endophytica]TCK27177.1 hypothetical protein EV378_3040 [Pseudonocardia endophytica]
MNARKRILAASLGLAGVVLPIAAAGTASADEGDDAPQGGSTQGYGYDSVRENSDGYPSTQGALQPVQAVLGTADTANAGFLDALDTFSPTNRPDEIGGTETKLPQPDPRLVEGPTGGLLKNGPFE